MWKSIDLAWLGDLIFEELSSKSKCLQSFERVLKGNYVFSTTSFLMTRFSSLRRERSCWLWQREVLQKIAEMLLYAVKPEFAHTKNS